MSSSFDYKGMQALSAIIEWQSFDVAAEKLHISQSAVSQRLKSLQELYSDPLLLRGAKYELTTIGEVLVSHYQKVSHLESETRGIISGQTRDLNITIAISRDILEVWFLQSVVFKGLSDSAHINIISDDSGVTYKHVQKGLAHCSLGAVDDPVSGCTVENLGFMRYLLVATKGYVEKHFKSGVNAETLQEATMLRFDEKDNLNNLFFETKLKVSPSIKRERLMPSVRGFKDAVMRGDAYALLPRMQIKSELESKKLVNIVPDVYWDEQIYFHHWALNDSRYNNAISSMKGHFKKILKDG